MKEQNSFHRAFAILADGSRVPIEAERILVEVEGDLGLLVELRRGGPGDGVAIRSQPERDLQQPGAAGSRLQLRGGGSNLFFLSPFRPDTST